MQTQGKVYLIKDSHSNLNANSDKLTLRHTHKQTLLFVYTEIDGAMGDENKDRTLEKKVTFTDVVPAKSPRKTKGIVTVMCKKIKLFVLSYLK